MDVTFEVSSDLFTLPEGQATVLAEKLRLFAAGQFRDDVRKLEELGTSRAWLAGTRVERQAAAASFAGRSRTPEVTVIPSCASADWTSFRAL